jgi:bidirectional [NiFe] hydrogenase diaphorase subunit
MRHFQQNYKRRSPMPTCNCASGTITPRSSAIELHLKIEKNAFAIAADLELLEELCDMVKNTSLCGLGQSAPNPVFSTLRYFRDEYLALIDGSTSK